MIQIWVSKRRGQIWEELKGSLYTLDETLKELIFFLTATREKKVKRRMLLACHD